MSNDFNELNEISVRKAVLTNAIPAMLGMIMVLIYNMADLFFIGQTGDDLQVAAVSLATPIFLMFMSLGNVFGVGGASMISRNLGSGNHDLVRKISSFCLWGSIFVGILLSIILTVTADKVVIALGASNDTANLVKSYINILCISGPFILISNCHSALVRAEGKPEKAMIGMLIGNLVNILLDPIFILFLNLGIKGAAIATVIGNICGGTYYIIYLFKSDTMLSKKIKDFSMSEGILKNIMSIGIPASLSTILMGVSQMLLNGQMSVHGDLAVAGIGVAMKVTMITTMVCIGIGMGVQPLLGYAIGSKNEKRYKDIFKFAIIFAVCLSGILTIICYLTLNQIVGAFVSDPESFEYAYYFSQVLISTSVISSVLFVLANALQAAGAAMASLIVNTSRQGIIYIPLLFIMGNLMGIDGLVFAQPLTDIISIILAGILYKIVSKKFF